jgi:hypothetical protein
MLSSFKKAYLYFVACRTIIAAPKVFDLSQKLHEKKEKTEQEKLKEELAKSLPVTDTRTTKDQLTEKREQKFLQDIEKESGTWMHRFSDVRRDGQGFYILKTDNPAGKEMRTGDQLADYAINMTPYWKVINVVGHRINLEPINSNPFKTGIGAGGAKITKHDLDVYTGEHERKIVDRINKSIDTGDLDIDKIKYILLGTVPVHFGPNGSQGGWYNASDTRSNRGGNKGLTDKDIMMADAKTIKDHGIPVPLKALDGTMDVYDWDKWIGGNGTEQGYYPKDVDKYVDFSRQMTQKGKWRMDDKSLEDMYRSYDPVKLEAYFDEMLQDATKLSKEEWELKYPYYEKNIASVASLYERSKRKQEKARNEALEYLTEGETPELSSIMKNVFSKERRVSNRNVLYLIEMCKEDMSYVKYLHDIINLGGSSDYLTNEAIIKFFNLIDDVDGLKLAAVKLTEPDNIRYTLSYLYEQGQSDLALSELSKHLDNLEIVNSVLGNISREYETSEIRKTTFGRNDKLLKAVKDNNIVQKIQEAVAKGDVFNKHHASELAYRILTAFGPTTMWESGDEELVSKLKTFR